MHLTDEKIKFLEEKANDIRQDTIKMLVEAKSGHSAGPLGMADIFTALYFEVLKHDPKNPDWEERDRLVLSNGHVCPVMYTAMAHAGYFPMEEIMTLRKYGTRLQGHPHRTMLPGLETSSGPLGSGLSQAIGMALAMRMECCKGSSNSLILSRRIFSAGLSSASIFPSPDANQFRLTSNALDILDSSSESGIRWPSL